MAILDYRSDITNISTLKESSKRTPPNPSKHRKSESWQLLMYSSMENLNNEDIRLLRNYREKIHSLLEKQFRSLDFTVVKKLFNDLLAQGIEKVYITKGLTRLTKLICHYVKTTSLAEDGKVHTPKICQRGQQRVQQACFFAIANRIWIWNGCQITLLYYFS
jgi:hypothetical protein